MVINISEIISTTGKSEQYTVPLEMEQVSMNGILCTFASKQPVELIVTNTGNREVLVEGHVEAILNIPCDRCLVDVPTEFKLDIRKDVDFKSSDAERVEALDETSYIDHSQLDVELLVYNEILIHFPMKTLCRSDCKGLCFKCGHNLNEGECGCNRESLDPRMAAFQDIFNSFKEV